MIFGFILAGVLCVLMIGLLWAIAYIGKIEREKRK